MLKGLWTALVTPFNPDGSIDERGMLELIDLQTSSGVDGIVLFGTTGESPTLAEEEKIRLFKRARERVPHSILLAMGTGSYSTEKTIQECIKAKDLGADAALVVTPYYNKPMQEGLYAHYAKIAESTPLPLVLYNVPGRTGVNLTPQTVLKLAKFPAIRAIKEASGNLVQMMELLETIPAVRPDFAILSGDDNMTLPLMSLGGHGVVSVVSNLVPEEVSLLVNACLNNDWSKARELHFQLLPLFRAAFIETNPIPIKTLMNFAGLPAGPCRLPLTPPDAEHERKLRHLYETLKLPLLTHG